MKSQILALSIAPLACSNNAAGEFVNFTFDEPDTSQFVNGKAPIEAALRGWTVEWVGGPPTYWWWGPVGVESGGYPVGLDGLGSLPGSQQYHVTVWKYWHPRMPETWGPYRPTLHLWQMGLIPTNAWQLSLAMTGVDLRVPAQAYIDGYRQEEFGMPGTPGATHGFRVAG